MPDADVPGPPRPPPGAAAWIPLGLCVPGFVAGCACAAFPGTGGAVLRAVALALAGASLLGTILWTGWMARGGRLRRNEAELHESRLRQRDLSLRLRGLLGQVELLTAMREMSRLVSGELDTAHVVGEVFDLLKGLLDPERMVLYLLDEDKPVMRPRAVWEEGVVTHGDPVAGPGLASLPADGPLGAGGVLREAQDGRLVLTAPLATEQTAIGALQVTFQLSGESAERERSTLTYEQMVRDIAQHLAFAVRAPALRARAMRDGLTGLLSKRTFEDALAEAIAHAQQVREPLSLILLDLDHFKLVNDTHGHPAGDAVLAAAAARIQTSVRGSDSAYRYGGEEFAVLLPGSDADRALSVAERIRERIGRAPVPVDRRRKLPVTASLGVACLGPGRDTSDSLLQAADQALYAAKHAGRNRAVLSGDARFAAAMR